MCDTILACKDTTLDKTVILAKNSDREPRESQDFVYIPTKIRSENNATQKCTYISVQEPKESNAMFLSKPDKKWGGEMGVNSFGVAIGNEAVFTKEPLVKTPTALTGMDFIRLALQQSKTSLDAVQCITEHLNKYGQGGNHGMNRKLSYHNSFIIADPNGGWVLETAGKHWVAKKITKGVYSISNGLTLGEEFDLSSKGIQDYALKRGYFNKSEAFNFSKAFSNKLITWYLKAAKRRCCAQRILAPLVGSITAGAMIKTLRNHGDVDEDKFLYATSMDVLCLHASMKFLPPTQTTASMVSVLRPSITTTWATSSSGACTGIFKPFFVEAGVRGEYRTGKKGIWWKHEQLHRRALTKPKTFKKEVVPGIHAMEAKFMKEEEEVRKKLRNEGGNEKLAEFSKKCMDEAEEFTRNAIKTLEKSNERLDTRKLFTRMYWNYLNIKDGIQQFTIIDHYLQIQCSYCYKIAQWAALCQRRVIKDWPMLDLQQSRYMLWSFVLIQTSSTNTLHYF
eukprot:TRINITY_DN2113_c0_g1_i1.p1 TRINITY_DN2113_c0_g1~~TRINITY_DN2113_c0_g1_i1.p1  ORF type:complete len:508 (-),score=26.70 TRINITY_DN2113_c0_g1_i1:1458-2981(-)